MPHAHRADKATPAETITNAIIARLEAGVRPWRQPWTGTTISRPLRSCGTPYRGMNVFWLWMVAEAQGFASPYWMTYNQAQSLGAQVRKGSVSTIAIFYRAYVTSVDEGETGDSYDETRRVLKSFRVFNASQIDGLPARYFPVDVEVSPTSDCAAAAEAFLSLVPAMIREGDGAWYDCAADTITMPPHSAFFSPEQRCATLAHELAHWTGHMSRLDRSFGTRFGDAAYAMEELVAELAAAMIGADLGLPVDHLDDHASYIATWLKMLKADPRAILTAAAKAEAATSFLLGYRETDAGSVRHAA
jgi:antirestriction protein ArdC